MNETECSMAVVRRVVEATSGLARSSWHSFEGDDLARALRSLESASRQVDAALAAATAEHSGRLERDGRSAGSAAQASAEATGVTAGVARSRAEAGARAGTPGMVALAQGRITSAAERVIAEHTAELPTDVTDAVRDRFAHELVEAAAGGASPRQLAKLARAELVRLDPTRLDRVEEEQQKRRSLRIHRPAPDGTSAVAITADPRLQALLDAVFARFGGPGQCVAAVPDPETGELPDATAARAADPRSASQRAYDALCHVLALGLGADPSRARGVASIVVRITPEQLDQIDAGGGLVETAAGSQLSVRQAVSLAGARSWFVSALRAGREELRRIDVDAHPRARLASTIQRLVLYSAHGGCTYPGCEVPSARCQAHHVHDFSRGGPTTVANLTDVCPVHHGWVGHDAGRWRTSADPARPGTPRWIPPGTPVPGWGTLQDTARVVHRRPAAMSSGAA